MNSSDCDFTLEYLPSQGPFISLTLEQKLLLSLVDHCLQSLIKKLKFSNYSAIHQRETS